MEVFFNFVSYWKSLRMAYSIHGYFSYILDANSQRPNYFSLIGEKLNKNLRFKWKILMALKFKPKLNSKVILSGSETINLMKGSKNRRGLTQIKTIYFFVYKQSINIDILWQQGKLRWKYCFWLGYAFGASYWHINGKTN